MTETPNPMGLLAPLVAAIAAALQTMVATEVEKALTARAGAANAAALLDDELTQKVKDIALQMIDSAFESHCESYNHPTNDDVRELIDESKNTSNITDIIVDAIENYDFDDKIAKALDSYDLEDKITDAMERGSFSFSS